MANPLENDCENANTHTHVGVHLVVLALAKEMKLELMWINLVMKQRQKGYETPSAPCIEKAGFHSVHRTLVTQ